MGFLEEGAISFPQGSYNKLKEKKIGPCRILEKINNNAYKIDLPPNFQTHPSFNVKNLSEYFGENDNGNSWTSFSLPGENDEIHS